MPTVEQETAMMAYPDKWPMWPFLPLKRREGPDAKFGILVDGRGSVVFLANLYMAAEQLKTCQKIPYPDYRTLAEDGWQID